MTTAVGRPRYFEKMSMMCWWCLALLMITTFSVPILAEKESTSSSSNGMRNKHIVLMVLDDMGWADTGVQVKTNIPTPNLNDLAKKQGIILDNYYTQTVCSPTRTCLMTGRYPFRTGMQHISTQLPLMASGVPLDTPMLAQLLTHYESHHIGKHHLGYATWKHTPTGRGFKSYLGYLQGQVDYYDHTVGLAAKGISISGLDLWDGRKPLHHLKGNYTLDLYQKRAMTIIHSYIKKYDTKEKQAGHPLFIYYAHQIAHIPLQAKRDEAERCGQITANTPRRVYCSMIVELDDAIGHFVNMLKHHELWDDTLVIVTTDNGGMVNWQKDPSGNPIFPSSVGSNTPLRGSKATLFEGGVRSLAFITGGAIPEDKRGGRFKGLAHAVDLTATILSIAGILPLNRESLKIDGFDLLGPLFHSSPSHRSHVPINILNGGKSYSAVRFGKYKLILDDLLAVAAQGWFDQNGELVEAAPADQQKATLLFDLEADPTERTNLAAKYPELVQYGMDLIQSYVIGGDFYEPILQTSFFPQALPILHGGVWMPFMSESKWRQTWLEDVSKQKSAIRDGTYLNAEHEVQQKFVDMFAREANLVQS